MSLSIYEDFLKIIFCEVNKVNGIFIIKKESLSEAL